MQPCVHLLLNSGHDDNLDDDGDGDNDVDADDDDDDDDGDADDNDATMMTMIRGRVVRELSADQLGCGPRLHTEVPSKHTLEKSFKNCHIFLDV